MRLVDLKRNGAERKPQRRVDAIVKVQFSACRSSLLSVSGLVIQVWAPGRRIDDWRSPSLSCW